MLELSILRGVTLSQAAEGSLRRALRETDEGEAQLAVWLATAESAAECALPGFLSELLPRLT
jgi:hypothetical protein